MLISGVRSVPSENDDLLNPPFKWCQSGIFNKTVIAINRFLQESVIHIQVLNGFRIKLLGGVVVHPEPSITDQRGNMRPQHSVLALASMVEHHASIII